MTRSQSLTVYAFLIIIIGVLVFSLSFRPSEAIQYLVGFGMLVAAVFSGITSYKCKFLDVPFSYHLLHSIGYTVYGIIILIYATSSEKFLHATSFFLLYYAISEMIFCFQLAMLKRDNINFKTAVYRLVIGLLISVGSFIIIIISSTNYREAILASGIVLVFCGINLLLFRTVLKDVKVPI